MPAADLALPAPTVLRPVCALKVPCPLDCEMAHEFLDCTHPRFWRGGLHGLEQDKDLLLMIRRRRLGEVARIEARLERVYPSGTAPTTSEYTGAGIFRV